MLLSETMAEKVRVRFAPSPTGQLHIGNVRTALFNWLFARQNKGKFILRIEDTDVERSEARYETQLLEDLRWMGLDWDEGPDVGGPFPPYRQSDKMATYRAYADRLIQEQKAYYCFCTPEELELEREEALKQGRQPVYSGKCRRLDPAEAARRHAAGEPAAIRLKIPEHPIRFHDIVRGDVEFSHEVIGDQVIVRSNGLPIYNYAVVIDDADMKITHVIRGDDHVSNTPRQVAVYEALGIPVPQFAHLSTILGPDRERLSKRHGATSVANFREMGILPEALMNYLALLGWAPSGGDREIFSKEELIKAFDLRRVTPSPAIFDFQKLYWINRYYIKQRFGVEGDTVIDIQDYNRLIDKYGTGEQKSINRRISDLAERTAKSPKLSAAIYALASFIDKGWLDLESLGTKESLEWFLKLVGLFAPYADRLDQIADRAAPAFKYDAAEAIQQPDNADVLRAESSPAVIKSFAQHISNSSSFDAQLFKVIMNDIKNETGVKGKDLFHPVRIMLIGHHSGPDFDKLIPVIEEGSKLNLPVHVKSTRERVQEFMAAMERRS